MTPLQINRDLLLPRDASYYSDPRKFPVELATSACGTHRDAGGAPHPLQMDPAMAAAFAAVAGKEHAASVQGITEAAMRFYRTGTVPAFAFSEFMDELFLLRNEFGHAFRPGGHNSLAAAPYEDSKRHSEASRKATELFVYGLALDFMAHVVGVPVERFFFITGTGARADFRYRVTFREMAAAGAAVHLLNPAGQMVHLEVKAKTGWGSFRPGSDGKALALNLATKATASAGKIFCAVLVAIGSRTAAGGGTTKIFVADPGEPDPLSRERQAEIILDELLTLALRYGLHRFAGGVMNWLDSLGEGGVDQTGAAGARQQLRSRLAVRWPSTLARGEREVEGRLFEGEVISEFLETLGDRGASRVSREEAAAALRLRRLGRVWLRAVDTDVARAVRERDVRGLLAWGVRGRGPRDLSGRSAFYAEEVEASDDYQARIVAEAEQRLREEA